MAITGNDNRRKKADPLHQAVDEAVRGWIKKVPRFGDRFKVGGFSAPELGRPNKEEFIDWLASVCYQLYVPATAVQEIDSLAQVCLLNDRPDCGRTLQPLDYRPLTEIVTLKSAVIWCGIDLWRGIDFTAAYSNPRIRHEILNFLQQNPSFVEIRSYHDALDTIFNPREDIYKPAITPKIRFATSRLRANTVVSTNSDVFTRLYKNKAESEAAVYQIIGGDEQKSVHRLVANEFIGDVSERVVDHDDEDKHHNESGNLVVTTHRDNLKKKLGRNRHDQVLVEFTEKTGKWVTYESAAAAARANYVNDNWLHNAIKKNRCLNGKLFFAVEFIPYHERQNLKILITGSELDDMEITVFPYDKSDAEFHASYRGNKPYRLLEYPEGKRGRKSTNR